MSDEEWWKKDPKDMTNEELVEQFASTYRIHSNPVLYNRLKAGHDEILRRLNNGRSESND